MKSAEFVDTESDVCTNKTIILINNVFSECYGFENQISFSFFYITLIVVQKFCEFEIISFSDITSSSSEYQLSALILVGNFDLQFAYKEGREIVMADFDKIYNTE